jgi:hypothetical protein
LFAPSLPPEVLQYVNKTLILTHASLEAAKPLPSILDIFVDATGLAINLTETTFITLNAESTLLRKIISAYMSPLSSFQS